MHRILLTLVVTLIAVGASAEIYVSTEGGRCLDVRGGNPTGDLITYKCQGSPNQQFQFDSGSFTSQQTGKCVTLKQGAQAGSQAVMGSCSDPTAKWTRLNVQIGLTSTLSSSKKMCLGASWSNNPNEAVNVILVPCSPPGPAMSFFNTRVIDSAGQGLHPSCYQPNTTIQPGERQPYLGNVCVILDGQRYSLIR